MLTNKYLRGYATLGVVFLFIVLNLIVHYSALSANWRWDDPAILLHAHRFSILDIFSNPEIWREFSPANLTPWLILSFEIDLALFGLKPEFFYLHQLISLSLVSTLLYLCLNLWTRRSTAIAGALIFSSSTPSFLMAQQLMTRHYVEGAVFCLASLFFFVTFTRTSKIYSLMLSCTFYILAVTAKEIYVPLIILYILIPEGEFGKRMTATIPFALIAFGYVLWRGYMLGSLTGGYVSSSDYLELIFLAEIFSNFSQFPVFLYGSYGWFIAALYLLILILYFAIYRSGISISIAILGLCLLPLIPLIRFPGITMADRYLFLFALILSFSVAFYAEKIWIILSNQYKGSKTVALSLCISIIVIAGLANSLSVRDKILSTANEFDAHADLILTGNNTIAFIPSTHILSSYWFVTHLRSLKKHMFLDGTSPIGVVDEIYLEKGPKSLLVYSAECACMRESVSQIQDMIDAHHGKLIYGVPIEIEFGYSNGNFRWKLGPYDDGEYHIVSDLLGVIAMPRQGERRVFLADEATFYIRYTSPDGWISYSSLQQIQYNNPKATRLRG